jgi:hypothetical protein
MKVLLPLLLGGLLVLLLGCGIYIPGDLHPSDSQSENETIGDQDPPPEPKPPEEPEEPEEPQEPPVTPPTAQAGDLVGHWRFEEDSLSIQDDTVFQNSGNLFGVERVPGHSGKGLRYDGGGQFFDGDAAVIPHSQSLDITSPFAVEAMIRVTGQDKYYAIVDKYRYLGSTSEGFTLYLTDGRIRMSIYAASNGDGGAMGTTDLRDGGWHHVRGTWTGKNIELYVDCVLEKKSPWTFAPASTPNPMGIGKRLSGWGGYMPLKGDIDSVEICLCHEDTAPDPDPTPPDPVPPYTVGEWLFEGADNQVGDETDYANHGTLFGATRIVGYSGNGLRFHGGGQFYNGNSVVVPHSPSLAVTGPFSVEAMIRCTGTDHYYAIVDKYRYLGSTSEGFTLYLTDGRIRMSIYGGSSSAEAMGTTNLRDSLWHHVCGTWDGTKIVLTVDYQVEQSVDCSVGPAGTIANLGIGKRLSGWGGYMPFHGDLDSVRLKLLE